MINLTFLLVVLIVVSGWLVLRQAPNPWVRRYPLTRTLQWAGLVILVAYAGFWTWWGIAEMTTDPSGFIHLFPVLPIACLLYLGWRQPGIVGVGLLLLGLIMLALSLFGSFELNALLSGLLIVQGPFFISGLCLLLADRLARRFADHPQASSDDAR